ncbi:TPA: site-specific DNA-methyltransferase [Escherichia coli]|nr:site-specific DNA-methyltransferase [Escherichia coli]
MKEIAATALHFLPADKWVTFRIMTRTTGASEALVADFFVGSGSTVKAAISLGRRAIGLEFEDDRFYEIVNEIKLKNISLLIFKYFRIFYVGVNFFSVIMHFGSEGDDFYCSVKPGPEEPINAD